MDRRLDEPKGEVETGMLLQEVLKAFGPLPYAVTYHQEQHAPDSKIALHCIDEECLVNFLGVGNIVPDLSLIHI